ncbi:MAG: rRNA cytosine-C5-methyltransferase [Prevotellaceae bacterium]|jgi:16S rRNA C967 or C1407 C5-methylase (RsmB/RsmF family)/NOL1/NOP2/fmu family ribosome biogenesis protein|nr:rRNA cytosine-C5-methyltransferase [Prevotellaceae bacterium]
MNLPQAFINQIQPILGAETADFLQALQTESPVSIRLNDKVQSAMTDTVKWCETGFYLPERPLFTADPLFHAGAYYVQEASSMFVEQAVKQHINEPVRMLDLCAAPGGKSTHLSSLLPAGSLLVSNEIIRSRAYILAENLIKWGNANVVVTNNEPKDFSGLQSFFDAVLVDAPCSGEGMFRKDEGAIAEWSPDNVRKCAERQRDILTAVWSALKTDGILIYSTCTYNRAENEENVQWIIRELGAELLQIRIDEAWGITASDFGYRFYPHKTRGEGFFLSVLRKTESPHCGLDPVSFRHCGLDPQTPASFCHCGLDPQTHRKQGKKGIAGHTSTALSNQTRNDELKNQLKNPNNWTISIDGNKISALPKDRVEDIDYLRKRLNIMHAGIPLAEQKGKDFIPEAALALSKNIDLLQVNTFEADLPTALRFLQREAIETPDAPRGYLLIMYQGLPLGWVKNLGNRANNLYPNEWRIRMRLT